MLAKSEDQYQKQRKEKKSSLLSQVFFRFQPLHSLLFLAMFVGLLVATPIMLAYWVYNPFLWTFLTHLALLLPLNMPMGLLVAIPVMWAH